MMRWRLIQFYFFSLKMVLVQKELQNAYIGEYVPPLPPELCFTANTANSTVKLWWTWSPASVSLETSTDGTTWSSYSFGVITLSNVGDKVYFRSTSSTNTQFSTGTSNYYQFVMTWSIAASWDVTYLINKNWTTTLPYYCFADLFWNCTSLTSAPRLPATTLWRYSYFYMFSDCTNLETLPKLPATVIPNYCYYSMFVRCSKIKLSTTQTWAYQTPYRIPTTWTWSVWSDAQTNMFSSTWGTFVWTPYINQTYYTSNTVV